MKNDNNTYDIFLSYRRVGGFETAKHLFDLLVRDGYRVSFDIDTLRSGDFDIQLLHRIDQCTDFILILNAGAFDRSIDPASDRNKDWMRIELAYALEKKKNIIPIMLNGFTDFPTIYRTTLPLWSERTGPNTTVITSTLSITSCSGFSNPSRSLTQQQTKTTGITATTTPSSK